MSGCFGHDERAVETRAGEGSSIGHAGELLQGAIWHDDKPEPFLVTLPAPPFLSHARVHLKSGGEDKVEPPWKTKALRAARLAWNDLAGGKGFLRLIIESETPVGRGCGSSTSDCVAAIRAVGELIDRRCSAGEIAAWAIEAETAADATMFHPKPVAFRQRSGRILLELGDAYPPLRVIAADLGGSPVDTITRNPPAYSQEELRTFEALLATLQRSVKQCDSAAVARIATQSAIIHHRHYPNPRWADFLAMTERAGALGAACAHSGNLAIALLEAGDDCRENHVLGGLHRLDLPLVARYSLNAAIEEGCACQSH